jgi:CelD/BcsL family acetyltransferase involved in cellulose biosynthesis
MSQFVASAGADSSQREEAGDRATEVRPSPLRLFESVQAAGPFWTVLAQDAVLTPFQRPEWVAAWCRHVSPTLDEQPLLVGISGRDGHPLAMLPLGVVRRRGVRTAHWLGGTHANFNLGVMDRTAPERLTPRVLRALLMAAGRKAGVDAFLLTQMPYSWDGLRNPLAALGAFPSVERGYLGRLGPDAEAVLKAKLGANSRRNFARKERRLAEHGEIRFFRARTPAAVERLLDSYLTEKAEWFRRRGISDPFAAPGVRAFLTDAALTGLAEDRAAIELYGYEVGGAVLAVVGGAPANGRFCCMFLGMIEGELARYSPGHQLAMAVVADLCARGFEIFDLGVGDTAYKLRLCPEEEPLFDLALPVTLRGRAVAAGWTAMRHARRHAKRSPAVRAAVHRLRSLKAKAGMEDGAGGDDAG